MVLLLLSAVLLRKRKTTQSVLLVGAFVPLGGWLMANAERQMRIAVPADDVVYEAVLMSEPVEHGKIVWCDLLLTSIADDGGRWHRAAPLLRVRASVFRDTAGCRYRRLHVGDGIRARSRLEPSYGVHQSDCGNSRWLYLHGYHAQTFIYHTNWMKAGISLSELPRITLIRLKAMKLRSHLAAMLESALANHTEQAVVLAMVLGDKSQRIARSVRNAYSDAGVAHVLALSGLHLSIIYFVLSLLMGRRRTLWRQLLLLTAVWAYVVVVGMPVSAVRAATMLTLYGLISLLGRSPMSLNTLSVTAIVMLVVNPLNLYDAGFQLSFMAVLFILLWSPLLSGLPFSVKLRRWAVLRWLWELSVVSVVAQMGTAPLVAYYFGRLPTYFLLTNLLVIPCVTLILYLSVAFFCLSWLPAAHQLLAGMLARLAELQNSCISLIASLPGASIGWFSPSRAQVLGLYLLLFAAYLLALKMVRRLEKRHFSPEIY